MSTSDLAIKNKKPGLIEKVLFKNRLLVLFVFAVVTIALGFQAMKLKPDASFEKMIPQSHPFISNMISHADKLDNSANSIQVAVSIKEGDIFSKEFLETLQLITEDLLYLPGVDRQGLKSLWTPNVRWLAVTELGFDGGPMIPPTYNGSEASINELRKNVMVSDQVGRLVANNFKSSIIHVPLFDNDPNTGEALNYQTFSNNIENIRSKYQNDNVDIHIIGFAKKVGDLFEGILAIGLFAAGALLVTAFMLFAYTRCLSSTLAPIICSVVAVIWQLGLLTSFGFGLNAYSVLVPFLVFAIGVSHGVQIINAIAQVKITLNEDKITSARLAFRQLYIAGMIALVSDVVGFLTLFLIDIAVIKELAIAASLGVLVIIFTNLFLLPIVKSYTGVSQKTIARRIRFMEQNKTSPLTKLVILVNPKAARAMIFIAGGLFVFGYLYGQDLKIGDLDKGAPELRPNSRYNQDNNFIVSNYSSSSDVFVIMLKTEKENCVTYEVLKTQEDLQWHIEETPGVQSTVSISSLAKKIIMGMNEGAIKWHSLSRNQAMLNTATSSDIPSNLMDAECSMVPVIVFLDDHKAKTLKAVIASAQEFIDTNQSDNFKLLLAAGNAGIEAATNDVIESSQNTMLILVYLAVSMMVVITFTSIASAICIIIPLALTSVLCQALMAHLGIGVKVATLPVMALGVGIGVDYGIYIYNRLIYYLNEGLSLEKAYFKVLESTGASVFFTGITMAVGVASWIWSPIKFQADMGILLTFMFLLNMIGALCLLPALAKFTLRRGKSQNTSNDTAEI